MTINPGDAGLDELMLLTIAAKSIQHKLHRKREIWRYKMDRNASGPWPVAGFLMATALATTISGSAAAQSPAPKIFSRSSASAAQSYWTPQRMAAAKPKGILASGAIQPTATPLATGAPGAAGGLMPGGQAINRLQFPLLQSPSRPAAAPIPADGAFPGPYTTYQYAGRYLLYPISTIGKLFFTEPGVGNFVCSASVTYGGSALNIVWTAGHCVANGGHSAFYTNWLYCPSYDSAQGGVNPAVGCWSWSFATTSSEWFTSGTLSRDYAIIGLQPNGTVKNANVATVTGGLGFAWNWARDQAWFFLGYPAASPFTGGKVILTASEHRYDDSGQGSPPTNSWGSNQTPGASGSPGILFFTLNGGYINTDTSYYYTSQAGQELQGPYFDSEVCNFWKSNTGYTGTC
ncbi:MAG: hypothetical protein WBF43_11015 [Methylocella sp.]